MRPEKSHATLPRSKRKVFRVTATRAKKVPSAAARGPPADPSLPLAQPGDAVAVLPRRRRRAGARREAPDARRLEGRARHPLQVRRDRGPTGPAPARRSTVLGRERRRAVDVLVPERVRRARPRPVVRAQGPRPLPRGAARPAPPALSRGPGARYATSAHASARSTVSRMASGSPGLVIAKSTWARASCARLTPLSTAE